MTNFERIKNVSVSCMTIFEMIKKMSVEEMANFLDACDRADVIMDHICKAECKIITGDEYSCPYEKNDKYTAEILPCKTCVKKWLESEV